VRAGDSYRTLARYYRSEGNWQALVDTLQRHVFAEEEDVRVTALLCELARVFEDKLEDRHRADDAYDEILGREPEGIPEDTTTLSRLLERCQKNRRDDLALELTARLAALEEDPVDRGRHLHTAGALARDAVADHDRALAYFGSALDAFLAAPEQAVGTLCLQSLEAIDALLTERSDWRALEASYRNLIESLTARGENDLASTLWQKLAVVYLDRMNDPEAAGHAFERASGLAVDDPDD